MEGYISPNVKMNLNKNVHKFWHHFQAQFFMPLHMMLFILFGELAQETTFWRVEILLQLTYRKLLYIRGLKGTPNNGVHTMWKSTKNCARKWSHKLWTFLFQVTFRFRKMCHIPNVCKCRIVFSAMRLLFVAVRKRQLTRPLSDGSALQIFLTIRRIRYIRVL